MTSAVVHEAADWTLSQSRPTIPEGPYAVAGLRRAGLAAVQALRRHSEGAEVVGCEHYPPSVRRRDRLSLQAAGVHLCIGPQSNSLDFAPAPNVLIKNPGIGFEAPLIRAALQRGIPVLDELELGWRLSSAPMLAVTGTNGKSTVASLAAAVLGAAGLQVRLAGNTLLGSPLSA